MFRFRTIPNSYQFLRVASVITALTIVIQAAHGLDASNVLVLYNIDSPEGVEIAQYYANARPGVQLLGLSGVSTDEQISQDHYLDVIRPQVLAGLDDSTEVIVTTKGLPLRIENTTSNPGTYPGWRGQQYGVPILADWWENYSSLESELTRIDVIDSQEMMGDQAWLISPPNFPFPTMHHAANPYYKANQAFDRGVTANEGIRLASRLDGFTVGDVKDSIDRAQSPSILKSQQVVVVDDDPDAPAATVDRMTQLAADVLVPNGQAMAHDITQANITDSPWPVIGYVGHGSHAAGEGYIDALDFDLADGAVFHTWESFNAYSFQKHNNLDGQGLVGEWIEAGGTAGLGHVQEPGASAASVANEDILWDMLLQGYTFAEAAWAATPQLSFVNTVVGDPLMVLAEWTPGDVTLDGMVGIDDLNIVLAAWNQSTAGGIVNGDVTGDGFVGIEDLSFVLANWQVDNTQVAPAVIPEPASVLTAAFGLGFFFSARRSHRRS